MIFWLCLGLPAALSAKERRGANVVITRLDGQRLTGELIAVTSDSVVVLCAAAIGARGSVASVDIKAVHSIKVVRKSRAAAGAALGFLSGAVAGGLWGHHEAGGEDEELSTVVGALFIGAVGGFVGLVVGAAAGSDDEITISGEPEPAVRSSLAKLARLARERGAVAPPERAQVAAQPIRETGAGAAARPEAAPRAPKTPRFKLTWSAMVNLGSNWLYGTSTGGAFRFIGDYSDATGPFPADLWSYGSRSQFFLGCVDFAYKWNRHFSSEIELYAPGSRDHYALGELRFTSDLDGQDYYSSYSLSETIRSTSVLAGLNYRPFPSGFLRHQNQAFELGIAAGPAFVRIAEDPFPTGQSLTINRTTLTVRARAAYDFYFGRAVSIGFFGEYRWLKPHIPEYTGTADLNFYQEGSSYSVYINRTTSVTFPGRTFDMGGFACGMRLGLAF